jgi:hypothetical protein
MHSRGHIVPPLVREQLAVLRAFLGAMRDLPPLPQHVKGRRPQQPERLLDPLEPPVPVWEPNDDQVGMLQTHLGAMQLCRLLLIWKQKRFQQQAS